MKLSYQKRLDEIFKEKKHFGNYAFSLYYFIKRLHEKSVQYEITDIFFFSREGKFLKQLYDIYNLRMPSNNEIKTHYLYVSRKSVALPSMAEIENESFFPITEYKSVSTKKFLKALSFKEEEILVISKTLSYDIDKIESLFFESDSYTELIKNEVFREIYERKRCECKKNLLMYLGKSGLLTSRKPAIVDIGWAGTAQYCISKLIVPKKIFGFYLGFVGKYEHMNFSENKCGLLFDTRNGKSLFMEDYLLYENICVADHGATEGYSENGDPILINDSDCELYKLIYGKVQANIVDKFLKIHNVIKGEKELSSFEKYISLKQEQHNA